MTQDERERRMIEAARSYNEPPEPPREEIWAAVRESLSGSTPDVGPGIDLAARRRERGARSRAPRWAPWVTGLAAATLAVGFGLGRLTGPTPVADRTPVATAPAATGASLSVRLAAADHLGEAEALLTLFRNGSGEEDRQATARWARDLLSTTRLMLDSRAGQDPEMAQLLADLELILVQITSAASGSDPAEHELIEDGIVEQQLMDKLRTASLPQGASM